MKAILTRLRPLDFVAALLTVGLITAASVSVYSSGSEASLVRVHTAEGDFVYELATDTVVDFEGPIGITRVEIKDGTARVVSSSCREQICVNSGGHDSAGDWTACLPNRVFLEITGSDEAEVDGLSY